MLQILFLFSTLLHAQEQTLEEFCFKSKSEAQVISQKINFILTPVDKIQLEQDCFTINTQSHRRELISRYIRNLAPHAKIKFSSAENPTPACRIKVEKLTHGQKNQKAISVWPEPQVSAQDAKYTQTETSQIITQGKFTLQAYQSEIQGICRYIHDNRYDISLEVSRIIHTPVPTVQVLGHDPSLIQTQTQKVANLKTEIQLIKGERLHLGSILKQNQREHIGVHSAQASGLEQSRDDSQEIYLSID